MPSLQVRITCTYSFLVVSPLDLSLLHWIATHTPNDPQKIHIFLRVLYVGGGAKRRCFLLETFPRGRPKTSQWEAVKSYCCENFSQRNLRRVLWPSVVKVQRAHSFFLVRFLYPSSLPPLFLHTPCLPDFKIHPALLPRSLLWQPTSDLPSP